ncbi:MAG: type II toxin-antitoxin system RelE/ParE family toxin [Dehalococcoidia bacterium]|nr:type II toxin-antitoxin system RelE/ParE family toxin [Dehalococcoidia bacterium]
MERISDWLLRFRGDPRAAHRRIRSAAGRLRRFPFSGRVVDEFQLEGFREVVAGSYRILYLVEPDVVRIVAVFHGAMSLDDESASE